jgi:hypothetical protein
MACGPSLFCRSALQGARTGGLAPRSSGSAPPQFPTPPKRASPAAFPSEHSCLEVAHDEDCNSAASLDSSEDEPDGHFICFVPFTVEGKTYIYELDGHKNAPVRHAVVEGAFATSCGQLIQEKFIAKVADVEFSALALCKR